MSDAHWFEAKVIVGEALERPDAERARFVEERCAGRQDLRADVESLLEFHGRAGEFIEEPFDFAQGGPFTPSSFPEGDDDNAQASSFRPGTEIGSYRLLKEIGHGGMGTVFLAERADSAFEKHVAVKIVAGHVAPPQLIARFLEERRFLAALDHPNIAHLLDAGATAEGLPYVVMEYVDGVSIDVHCQREQLTLRRRLDLFRLVCNAVHHAHQRLIVHRDIKPANILVSSDGVPKLLDFGIAKLLEEGRGRMDTGLRAFTPESASPEQIRNEPVMVTSDVYSLGALLYRLLTEQKVFDFSSASDSDIMRMICEVDPVPPSQTTPQRERIARDLDWITLKALRKEPDRRYVSVAQLSDDCARYLAGQPVLAAPDTLGYRAAKFLRRHWVGASAAAAIAVTVAATGTAVWYARGRAERRFNDVRQLANSVVGELYDAIAEVPGSTAARQLLVTRALGYLDNLAREAGNDISLKVDLADAYQKIGDVQGNPYNANLGDVDGARASYTKLLDLRKAIHDARRDRQSAVGLGRAHSRFGDLDLGRAKYPEAVDSYQRALALLEPAGTGQTGNDDTAEDRARVYNRKGVALTWSGRRAEARTALEEAIRLTEAVASRPDAPRIMRRGLAVSNANLGDVFHYEKDYERALGAHRRATDLAKQLLQEKPSESTARRDVIMMLARVGGDLVELKRHQDAISATKEVIALEEELIKDDPRNVQFQFDLADLYGNLAASQRETGQLDAALRSIEQSIQTSERAAALNPSFVAHRFNFAGALSQLGRIQRDRRAFGEAVRAFRQSVDVYASVPGDQRDPAQVLIAKGLLAESLADEASRTASTRLWGEAKTALQQALDDWRAFQQGGGSSEDHREEIARLSAALDHATKTLSR